MERIAIGATARLPWHYFAKLLSDLGDAFQETDVLVSRNRHPDAVKVWKMARVKHLPTRMLRYILSLLLFAGGSWMLLNLVR